MQTPRRVLVPILAFLAAALPLAARAGDAAARKALEREYARYDRLSQQQDAKGQLANFKKILAPGFTYKDGNGQITTREQMLSDLEQQAKSSPSPEPNPIAEQKTTIERITVQRDSAVTLVTERQTRRVTDEAGRLGPRGQTHRITQVLHNRDLWMRKNSAWQIRSSAVVTQEILVDGKPQKPESPSDKPSDIKFVLAERRPRGA